MNGNLLALGAAGVLAAAGLAARRGSRATTSTFTPKDLIQIAVARLAARGIRVPSPTRHLDVGMRGGYVFETTDPTQIVRLGPAAEEREELLLNPEFKGGAVQIHGLLFIGGPDGADEDPLEEFVVTWKEKLNLDVENHIYRKYGYEETGRSILMALSQLSPWSGHGHGAALQTLLKYPETKGLARAIQRGMPSDDLDLNQNIGVNKKGHIVAFDL